MCKSCFIMISKVPCWPFFGDEICLVCSSCSLDAFYLIKTPESQVSVVARWTWGGPFLMGSPYQITILIPEWGSAARLNSHVSLSAKAHAAIILGKRAPDTSIPKLFDDSSSQSSIKSSTFKVNLYPGLPVGCWSSQQSINFLRPDLSCVSLWLVSFIVWAWLEARCFCQVMKTGIRADVRYILFIALGLT